MAIKICQEKELYYYSVLMDVPVKIYCKKDLRYQEVIQLNFIEEELEQCRK